jgi:hypothetical protein
LRLNPEVSKSEGRVAQTTNVIIGGTVTDDSTNEWIALDKKVNPSCTTYYALKVLVSFFGAQSYRIPLLALPK